MATPPLIVIVGPTASGKTALANELAEKFDGEIICADSRTVYKHLDIGTAKPTQEERARVPHHLLDVVQPDQSFTVADFKRMANEAIRDIAARGKLPILVGGSGLYIDAVLFDYQFSAKDSPRDEQNPRHAAKHAAGSRSEMRQNTLVLGLDVSREVLKLRITNRVNAMADQGFLEEVRYVKEIYPSSKALDAPGYKAFRRYLEGEVSLQEAKDLFIHNDYQLAKRQMTWFRRPSYSQITHEKTQNRTATNNRIQWIKNRGKIEDIVTTFLNKNDSKS